LDIKMKRTKYTNGGLHTSYSKGIFSVEGNASGNNQRKASSTTASVQGKNARASVTKNTDSLAGKSTNYNASVYSSGASAFVNKNVNTRGNSTTYGFQKQLPNNFSASAQTTKSSNGGKSTKTYGLKKQLSNDSSVSVQKNKYNTSASYHKQTKGGTNLQFGLNKNAQGVFGVSMGFSKPL